MTRSEGTSPIRAAGGLILRGDSAATAELALVHRPEYDDWSIPKGKHDAGESSADCALREVSEETGFQARIVGSAGTTRYRVRGRAKEVDYFLMRPYRSAGFRPNDEVDEVRWVRLAEAGRMLTYDFDRELVADLDVQPVIAATTLHLVRHAAAGDRSRWDAPDPERPLSPRGFAQSKALACELAEVGVSRIVTSPYVRCVQTVDPLGDQIGLELEPSGDLAEGAGPREIDRLLKKAGGSTTVFCSHGDVIPAVLERLRWLGVKFRSPYACQKGSTWVIGHDGTAFTDATYVPPPAL